jgi:hypothetical protein
VRVPRWLNCQPTRRLSSRENNISGDYSMAAAPLPNNLPI